MGTPDQLSEKTEVAIAALLTEPTRAAAAAKIGVSESTLQRWLRNPTFVRKYRAARRRAVETAIGLIQQLTTAAVETLGRNLSCGAPGGELRAAGLILAHAIKGVELIDFGERLDELERAGGKPAAVPGVWAEPGKKRRSG